MNFFQKEMVAGGYLSSYTCYKELRLVVTNAEDSNNSDHADWVDAGFIVPPQNH